MTDEELNRLAATKIMGWKLGNDGFGGVWEDSSGCIIEEWLWKPMSSREQAMMLWEKVKEEFWRIEITLQDNKEYAVAVYSDNGQMALEGDKMLPTAFTHAILKAKGVL